MELKTYYISINGILAEVTKEVYLAYYRSKRRDRYYEHDIKAETAIYDCESNIMGYAPSKEDSLERLMEAGSDNFDVFEDTERKAIHNLLVHTLHEALSLLTPAERELIHILYFSNNGSGMNERACAIELGLSNTAIHAQKKKVLGKLRYLLQNNLQDS